MFDFRTAFRDKENPQSDGSGHQPNPGEGVHDEGSGREETVILPEEEINLLFGEIDGIAASAQIAYDRRVIAINNAAGRGDWEAVDPANRQHDAERDELIKTACNAIAAEAVRLGFSPEDILRILRTRNESLLQEAARGAHYEPLGSADRSIAGDAQGRYYDRRLILDDMAAKLTPPSAAS